MENALGVQLVPVSNTWLIIGSGIIVLTVIIIIISNKKIIGSDYEDGTKTFLIGLRAFFGILATIMISIMVYMFSASSASDTNAESVSEHYNASFFIDTNEKGPYEKVLPTSFKVTKEDIKVNIVPNEGTDPDGIDGILRIKDDHAVLLVPENYDDNDESEYVEYGK